MVTYEEAKDRLRRRFSCLGRRRGGGVPALNLKGLRFDELPNGDRE